MAKKQISKKHGRYIVKAFSAIEFLEEENYDRVFEAVPDTWFTDDTKTFCYWPPKTTSKSLMISALNCARPDDDWNIYECKVVSGGHASYASAYKVVRDKCSQKYNTSSAEDRIKADDYRRKHPVLALQGNKSFENLFTKSVAKDKAGDKNISESNNTRTELTNDNASDMNGLHEDGGAAQSFSTVRENSSSEQSKQQKLSKSKSRTDASQIRKKSDSKHNTNAVTAVEKVVGNSGSNSEHSESSTSNLQSRSLHKKFHRPSSNSQQGSKVACSRNKTPESSISRSGSSRSRSGSFRSRSVGSQSRSVRPRSRSGRPRSRSGRPRSRSGLPRSCGVASRSRSEVSRSRCRESRSRSGGSRSRSGSSRSRSESSRSRSGSSRSRSESYRSRSQCARSRQTHLQENSKKQLAESLNLNVQSKQLKTSTVPEYGHSSSRKSTKYSTPRSRSSSSLEIIEHTNQPSSASRCQLREDPPLSTIASRSDNSSPKVDRLIKLLETCEQRQNENERRLIRMEVTLNKTFIMVGDLINAKNYNVQKDGFSNNELIDMESDDEMHEFDEPKFPITNLIELDAFKTDLKNRRYKRFLIMHERDFCTPSKRSTHNVTMTKYLSRFVSMEVRCELTLKEKSGTTLMGKYKRVYQFLLDVMRAGYRLCHKFITQEEAHIALRIVWGRSKQYKNADDKKRQQRTNRKKDRSRQHRRHH